MSQAGTVSRLAIRELWITFRLLLILAAFIGAGAVVALLPAGPTVSLQRLSIGLGIATIITAAAGAWSLAEERSSGRAGWLVTRSVSRGTYLVGWLTALAAVALGGLTGGALLGWVATAAAPTTVEAGEFVALVIAMYCVVVAAIGLGLLAGTMAPAPIAAGVATLACGLVGLAGLLAPDLAGLTPVTAYLTLPQMTRPEPMLADAMRAAGIGLSLAAVLLVAARLAMERAEL